MTNGLVDQLSVALEAAGHAVEGVSETQWDSPTGCTEWKVRDLVDHLITGNFRFAAIISGAPPASPQETSGEDADRLPAYHDSSRSLLAAFSRPGVLEEVFTVPFGTVPGIVALHLRTVEALVHGWDLAEATGQSVEFPLDLAEQELQFSRAKLADLPPDRAPFAPPKPVADDAPAIDRLAALLGRPVTTRIESEDRTS